MNGCPYIPAWLDDAGLPLAEFRIYCDLCRRADNTTGEAWPSYDAMAMTCGVSRATIARSLKQLESRGFIAKTGKPFGGSCRYRITPPIVSPEARLAPNSLTGSTIEDAPIVSPENCNRSPDETPIVSPEAREGSPIKVLQKRKSTSFTEPNFPAELSSDAFREAWGDWAQHRKEIRKPLTPASMAKQLSKLAEIGELRAIAAINHSIANGWQGIFEPKASAVAAPQPKRAADLRL